MALLSAGCLSLLLFLPYASRAADCDLGPADVIFIVKASHLMTREDFGNVKEFMKEFSQTLDIGRDNTTSHVGAVFFDNIGPPQTRIAITAYSRLPDLHTAIDGLARLPCGTGWCKEKESSFRPALDYSMSRFPKGRMKKIILISSGNEDPKLKNEVAELTANDPWLRVLIVFLKGTTVTADNTNYNYLQAYHDPYKRYAERMSQLFPNVSVPIPPQPTPHPFVKQVEQGRIVIGMSDELSRMGGEVCQQLFSCPPCGAAPGGRDPFDKETPIQSKLPQNWKQEVQATTKAAGGATEDYEYEITADPPGLTINTNPAKNRREMSTTPMTSVDYVYEDSSSDDQGVRRSKRASLSPRQKDCVCAPTVPITQSSSVKVDSTSEAGCTGSTDVASGGCTGTPTAAYAVAPSLTGPTGCGGATDMTGSGCGAPSAPQPVQYYPSPNYQAYQQYATPCRYGSPCKGSYYQYGYGYSPCGRMPCGMAQQQYLQYPDYRQNYGYANAGQQAQPSFFSQPQQSVIPQQPQFTPNPLTPQPFSQPPQGSYATIPLLPSVEGVHDGSSVTISKEEKVTVKNEEREKVEKPPSDPFSFKAFGGSQFTKISSGSLLDGLFPPNPPPIDSLLEKFDAPAEDFAASMAPRKVTLKPADIGSTFTDVEELAGRRKRH